MKKQPKPVVLRDKRCSVRTNVTKSDCAWCRYRKECEQGLKLKEEEKNESIK